MKTNKKLFLSILALSSINFSVIHAAHKFAPPCFVKNGDDEFDSCASCKKASLLSKGEQETCCQYLFDSKRAGNKNVDLLTVFLLLSSFNGPNWVKNNEKEMVNDIAETTGCDYKTSKDALHRALHESTKK